MEAFAPDVHGEVAEEGHLGGTLSQWAKLVTRHRVDANGERGAHRALPLDDAVDLLPTAAEGFGERGLRAVFGN